MSSRLWWVACLLLGLAVQAGDRAAVAGEFDGTWVGKIGCRRDALPLEARVENYRFTANLGRGPAPVTGIIRADHSLNLYWDGDNYLYGKFHGERFEGRGEFSRGNCRFRLVREAMPESAFLGPHDGAWHLEQVTGCLAEEKIKGVIHVRGGGLNGIAIGFLTYEFAGTVDPDGGFEGLSSAYAISGRFEPDQARADLQYRELDGACTGTAVLSRTWPSSTAQLAALPKPADPSPPNPESPDALLTPPVPKPKPPPVSSPDPSPPSPARKDIGALLDGFKLLLDSGEIDQVEYSRLIREAFEVFGLPVPEIPPVIVEPEPGTIKFGRYFALVIGNNDYVILDDLKTAVHDARVVAEILENDYGFTVALLIDVTRAEIFDELDRLGRTIEAGDNFLIYYAGHGLLKKAANRGYWLPVDAEPNRQKNWISNADITDTLRAVRARHAIVVADSCFSGTLSRGNISEGGTRSPEGYYSKISKIRSRNVLTSGALEPVADGGGGGHSVFARAFIEELRANQKIIEGDALAYKIKQRVLLNADQTPLYGDIRQAGHVPGGDFIFVRKEYLRSIKAGAR
jgi:hypothetical protein